MSEIKPRSKWAVPIQPYRPMPTNFPELFAQHGWDGIEAECGAHKSTIKRWMLDYGEDTLRQMRRDWLERKYAALGRKVPGGWRPGRAKRYVLGRTLSAVIPRAVEE